MSTCCPPQEVEDVFSYYQIKEHPKLLLAMTGLSHTEFDQLLRHFQYAWDQYVQNNYIDRDSRKRQYGAGRAESTLVHREDKLLFILYSLKRASDSLRKKWTCDLPMNRAVSRRHVS
jgi:hypothetical protein